MIHTVEREVAGKALRLETGKVAKQAGGSVWLTQGDTVVQATATMAQEPRPGTDFFPLTCDYEERLYAVGRVPGGFIKRGGRPSEKGILTSRLIDRPLRPLFPDGMRHDVQVIAMPLSVDHEFQPDILAITAASAALTISNIPFNGPVGGVRVGRIGGEFIANPTPEQIIEGDLDLVVAGTQDAVLMIEAGARFVNEADMLAAIEFGHEVIKALCAMQLELAEKAGKPKTEVPLFKPSAEILAAIEEGMGGEIRGTIQNPDKAARESAISDLKKQIVARFVEQFPDQKAEISEAAEKAVKRAIRSLILEQRVRPDGRGLTDIRPITCEIGLLPRVHGTGLFTRGQTQVLTNLTLAATSEAQTLDNMDTPDGKKYYMHFYNFPPYSVGETRPLRAPGRREIGHGALAERSLLPVLPPLDDFPYTMLLISECLESNGSTSMASVCGSTLALMDAGVKIKAPVAGIAMGLMTQGDQYAILSDIQGMEDFSGDMDFKVAGTAEGITAIQLDCKISGLSREIMQEALEQARVGRLHILGKITEAIAEPRAELSQYAPSIFTIEINPERIGELIGPGGKNIRKLQSDFQCQIDVQQDGKVFIAAVDQIMGKGCADAIQASIGDIELGTTFVGKVSRLLGMGALVEMPGGREGLVHISHLRRPVPRRPEEVVKVGEEIPVRVVEVDPQGRVNLSAIDLDKPFEPSMAKREEDPNRPPRPGGDRGGRGGDRGGRGFGGDRGGDRPPFGGDRGPRPGGPPPAPAPAAPIPQDDDEDDGMPKARFRPRR